MRINASACSQSIGEIIGPLYLIEYITLLKAGGKRNVRRYHCEHTSVGSDWADDEENVIQGLETWGFTVGWWDTAAPGVQRYRRDFGQLRSSHSPRASVTWREM
jgi:hypothetical protein